MFTAHIFHKWALEAERRLHEAQREHHEAELRAVAAKVRLETLKAELERATAPCCRSRRRNHRRALR